VLGGAYPSADRATAGGSPSNDIYATSFTITLLGGSGNFQNYKVTEYDASPGTDTCVTQFSDPAYIPPHPVTSGGVWYVQGTTWGPDNVGWLPASVQYIRQHPGVVNIPCDATIHQALDILCPGWPTPYLYSSDNPLDVYTFPVTLQNCRGPISNGQVCGSDIAYRIDEKGVEYEI